MFSNSAIKYRAHLCPGSVLGSLEKTQLLLLQPEREEKGANTGESGEGGDREEGDSFQGERVLLGRAMSHL